MGLGPQRCVSRSLLILSLPLSLYRLFHMAVCVLGGTPTLLQLLPLEHIYIPVACNAIPLDVSHLPLALACKSRHD
jgi:hypothetical protein